jgi:hypothetical protein
MIDSHNPFRAARENAPADFSIAMFPLSDRVRFFRVWIASAACRCVSRRRKIDTAGNHGNAPGMNREIGARDKGV